MYDKLKWAKNLEGSLVVVNGNEVLYIKEVADISSIYRFIHSQYLYTELSLKIEATAYKSYNSNIKKQEIKSATTLTLSNDSVVIKISEENIALLLTDTRELVRNAALDWYQSQKAI